jgi:hypothetical protein
LKINIQDIRTRVIAGEDISNDDAIILLQEIKRLKDLQMNLELKHEEKLQKAKAKLALAEEKIELAKDKIKAVKELKDQEKTSGN